MITNLRLIILAAVLVAFGGVYFYGVHSGKESERVKSMKASIEAYKTRNEINEEVNNLDDVAICIELGGLPDECDELRGLDQASESQ